MTKTYAQLKKQIEALSREAEGLKQQERDGVIERIKEAISIYELTAAELGLGGARRGSAATRSNKPGKPGRKPAARKTGRTKASAVVKFRDADGHVWGGRGPRPQWLREALAAGKTLADFAV